MLLCQDATAVRAQLQTQAFQEYYAAKLGYGDDQVINSNL